MTEWRSDSTRASDSARSGRLLALFCGVSDYDDPEFWSLPYCGKDAADIARVFEEYFPSPQKLLWVLTSGNDSLRSTSTRANLLLALSEMTASAQVDDTVIVGFFGHGLFADDRRYLFLSDSYISAAPDTAVGLEDLKARLDAVPSKRKVLILDSCHSGPKERMSGRARGHQPMSESSVEFLLRLQRAEGWVVMAACRTNELAHDHDQYANGVFTHYLLEGLKGAADSSRSGFVSVSDLQRYVHDAVTSWARSHGVRQTPLVQEVVTQDFPLTLLPSFQPPEPSILSVAIMGVKGGVGKGTVINCAAQLLAEAGHDVVVFDFDLETAGATRDVRELVSVKTLFDHLASRAAGFEKHVGTKRETLWDITPPFMRADSGRIWLLPACHPDQDLRRWEVVANLPEPRDAILAEVVGELYARVKTFAPKARVVLIDCGAGRNPIYSAAFASSSAGVIISLPDPSYFQEVSEIMREHIRRHPAAEFGRIFTVINRVTSDSDIARCASLKPTAFLPRDPLMEQHRFERGTIDHDLGYDEFTAAVQSFLVGHILRHTPEIRPDEVRVRVWPWYSRLVLDGLAARLLRSPAVLVAWVGFWVSLLTGLVVLPMAIRAVLNPAHGLFAKMPTVAWTLSALAAVGTLALYRWQQRGRWLYRISHTASASEEAQREKLLQLLQQKDRSLLRWFHQRVSDANIAQNVARKLKHMD